MTQHQEAAIMADTICSQSEEIADLKAENARLINDIERLTDENLDLKRELGMKSEPAEYGC